MAAEQQALLNQKDLLYQKDLLNQKDLLSQKDLLNQTDLLNQKDLTEFLNVLGDKSKDPKRDLLTQYLANAALTRTLQDPLVAYFD